MAKKENVLVVDDSSLMRLVIGSIINEAPELELVGTASNGLEAVEMTESLKPDVVLMDITMEEYDGLYAIRRIMDEHPVPIVVLSAMGNSHPEIVFEALQAGAYDFLHKPKSAVNTQIRKIQGELVGKVVEAARVERQKLSSEAPPANMHPHTFREDLNYDVVAIGASTGGPRTLESLVQMLPMNLAVPVIIAQHMPEAFLTSFAKRLDQSIGLKVKIAEEGEEVRPGVIYIADGSGNMQLTRKMHKVRVSYTQDRFREFNNPSIDCLMTSVAEVYGDRGIGLILTGMGRDGARGLSDIHDNGGLCIAQDEKTSVIFGMPKAAISRNCVDIVLPLNDIAGYIVNSL